MKKNFLIFILIFLWPAGFIGAEEVPPADTGMCLCSFGDGQTTRTVSCGNSCSPDPCGFTSEEYSAGATCATSLLAPTQEPEFNPPLSPEGDSNANSDSGLNNPLSARGDNLEVIVKGAIEVVLGLVGVAALVIFIYGGILWMLSSGNEAQIAKAKKAMIWAVFGLVAILAAYAILSLVFGIFESGLGAAKPANP